MNPHFRFLGSVIIVILGCIIPVLSGMFRSIPGFYPLNANSIPLLSHDNQNVCRHCQILPVDTTSLVKQTDYDKDKIPQNLNKLYISANLTHRYTVLF